MESPLKPNNFGTQSVNAINQNITPTAQGANSVVGGGVGGVGSNQINIATRRSSRLFGSSQQSVKENSSKTQTKKPRGTGGQKSPSRKTKTRLALSQQSELEEKNEKNKAESKELKDSDEKELKKLSSSPLSASAAAAAAAAAAIPNLGAQALNIQKQSVDGLMSLMRQFGAAYAEISRYNCKKAVQLLEGVSPGHRNSAMVLGMLGRAHFELGEYQESKR